MTSTSNGLVVTVTVVQPVGSLAPAPTLQSSKGFLQNKAQMGVVFAIVSLIALALFGFLGYRFYKAGKNRQQRILEDEAQRVASRYRTRIDDEDDDDEDVFARRREMLQLPSLPSSPGHLGAELFQTAAAKSAPSSSSSHETSQRNPYSLERSRLSIRSENLEAYSQAESRRSTDTQTLLFSSTSGTAGPKRSNTFSSSTLQRSPTSATSVTSHSKKYYLSPDPFPPPLELPDTFGEDARPRTGQKPLEDDQDYHAMMGRVLKVSFFMNG
jgi:hypothetical protein